MGMKRYLIVDLIHVFIMISDSEHPFTCLLAIYISSLEKCLFKSFLIGMFFVAVVALSCRNCLNLPLSDTLFENIFSHSMCCLFTLLTVAFDTHVFNFNEVNLFFFNFVFFFSVISKKSQPYLMSWSSSPDLIPLKRVWIQGADKCWFKKLNLGEFLLWLSGNKSD